MAAGTPGAMAGEVLNKGLDVATWGLEKLGVTLPPEMGGAVIRSRYAGFDLFLMDHERTISDTVAREEKIQVKLAGDGGISWEANPQPYTCTIPFLVRACQLMGLKCYSLYTVQASNTSSPVTRRYKHFEWLHEYLDLTYPFVAVPPLRKKENDEAIHSKFYKKLLRMAGRPPDEEDELKHEQTRRRLEVWIQRVVRHPVLSRCSMVRIFLQDTDKVQLKARRTLMNEDQFLGADTFQIIVTPEQRMDMKKIEDDLANGNELLQGITDNVERMIKVLEEFGKSLTMFSAGFEKVSEAVKSTSGAFEVNQTAAYKELSKALLSTGEAIGEISADYRELPIDGLEPLITILKGLEQSLPGFPAIQELQQAVIDMLNTCKEDQKSGKLTREKLAVIEERASTVGYAIMAEKEHFMANLITEFNSLMQKFLVLQINFHNKLTSRLHRSLKEYGDLPDDVRLERSASDDKRGIRRPTVIHAEEILQLFKNQMKVDKIPDQNPSRERRKSRFVPDDEPRIQEPKIQFDMSNSDTVVRESSDSKDRVDSPSRRGDHDQDSEDYDPGRRESESDDRGRTDPENRATSHDRGGKDSRDKKRGESRDRGRRSSHDRGRRDSHDRKRRDSRDRGRRNSRDRSRRDSRDWGRRDSHDRSRSRRDSRDRGRRDSHDRGRRNSHDRARRNSHDRGRRDSTDRGRRDSPDMGRRDSPDRGKRDREESRERKDRDKSEGRTRDKDTSESRRKDEKHDTRKDRKDTSDKKTEKLEKDTSDKKTEKLDKKNERKKERVERKKERRDSRVDDNRKGDSRKHKSDRDKDR